MHSVVKYFTLKNIRTNLTVVLKFYKMFRCIFVMKKKIISCRYVYINFSYINSANVFLKYTGGMKPHALNNAVLRIYNTIDIYKSVI